MRIDAIPVGRNPPHDVNLVIEVPIGADQIRDGQGGGYARGRPLPLHVDALSGQLRVHPAHTFRRRRPVRCAHCETRARSFPAQS